MPHHDWSDHTFDWKSLSDAMVFICEYCKKYGRLGIHFKEKWGHARITPYFFDGSLHSFLYPGFVYCQYFNKWYGRKLWWLDIYVFPKISKYTGISFLVFWWQKKVYNRAFQIVLKKYPHIKDELLADIDCAEFVYGAIKVRDKYWKKVK